MALVNYSEILKFAKDHKCAIGAFNSMNMESVQAVVSAADTTDSPLIVQTYRDHVAFAGSDYFEIPWDNPLGTNIGTEVNVVCQGIIAGQNVTELFNKLQKLAQLEWA